MARAIDVLRPDQYEIIAYPAKRKFLATGRRWGKTVLGGCEGLDWARAGGRVAWVVPTFKNSRALWRMVAHLGPHFGGQVQRADMLISFPNAGFLGIYSADGDSADAMRGEAFHKIIIDEAARIKEEVYYDILDATVADTDGEITSISTPRGRNWFWLEFVKGLDKSKEQASWAYASNANPLPRIQKAFERARELLPEQTFRREWMAEFLESEGQVFRFIHENLYTPSNEDHKGHRLTAGIDWGQKADFTVISIGCANCCKEIALDRFNAVEYPAQRDRIKAHYERHHPEILAEANSMGLPNIQQLRQDGIPVIAFDTTHASKAQIIQAMRLAFEQRSFKWLDVPWATRELEAFEMKVTAQGNVTYGAPAGIHDDSVISRALMLRRAQLGGFSVA